MSTSRRTLVRTLAVSVLTGGALLMPAAASFAASPASDLSTHAESPALLAAGGGVAAAGAAGLGFAMLRRGRTDGRDRTES
ncbi:hypothetical protein [Streptomyces sp. N35]|uniref:hypothetical protein n=1 Tax=Streptomyces sp. N35 TaxID=2795730 RepID=UPI0018F33C00|nr:hypothetical protein [Streptomyces sp. N35]